ncbi:uncharacterized protein LOC142163836 [Nicotiana tabacum]|uniref:Uncharacterized protein LOC142163836 n=1 Tax=Nicotiana tabacum TaxID=4097 RepID=A0AC58RWH4_TOBAC
MPTYAKFLKEILSNKCKVEETSVIKITEHCSAILQNKFPQKYGDPGNFTIPYSLGSTNFKNLCVVQLEREIGPIKSVPVSLQLADQTTIIPDGIVEDVLVGSFIKGRMFEIEMGTVDNCLDQN